jgi:fibro-slime domain-containing protein
MTRKTGLQLRWSILVLCLALPSFAQPPDTVRVPVTFYDFHADGRNSDFENCIGIQNSGSVQNRLDAMGKPVFKANVNCNAQINQWYRPQGGSNAIFDRNTGHWLGLVPYNNRANEYVGTGFNPNDPNADVVTYDSLPFHYDAWTGLYIYENYNFFMLDNKGFGKEPAGASHNFAFTTEIQYKFVYVPGLVFDFIGDDDLLLFINDQLALDLGGIQHMRAGRLEVDTIASRLGLQFGQQYTFSIFHAERHTTESNIKIMTNLIMPPAYLFFYPNSGTPNTAGNKAFGPIDSIGAGDTLHLFARLFDTGFNPITDRKSVV